MNPTTATRPPSPPPHVADSRDLIRVQGARVRCPEASGNVHLGGAGHDGDRVVSEGTPADFVATRSTLTGEHLAAYAGV